VSERRVSNGPPVSPPHARSVSKKESLVWIRTKRKKEAEIELTDRHVNFHSQLESSFHPLPPIFRNPQLLQLPSEMSRRSVELKRGLREGDLLREKRDGTRVSGESWNPDDSRFLHHLRSTKEDGQNASEKSKWKGSKKMGDELQRLLDPRRSWKKEKREISRSQTDLPMLEKKGTHPCSMVETPALTQSLIVSALVA